MHLAGQGPEQEIRRQVERLLESESVAAVMGGYIDGRLHGARLPNLEILCQ
jgi:hypothetical protein